MVNLTGGFYLIQIKIFGKLRDRENIGKSNFFTENKENRNLETLN